jgi:hypothetical protein
VLGHCYCVQGCDIIARAAPYFMRHAPRCQLVIVGPVVGGWEGGP